MRIQCIQKFIDILRGKKQRRKNFISPGNSVSILYCKEKVNLNVTGKNNKIEIRSKYIVGEINIFIYGDNNEIVIAEDVIIVQKLKIEIGAKSPIYGKVINSTFFIDSNSSLESMSYTTLNSNVFCEIGKNCLISYDVKLFNTDAHPIFKKGTKKIINKIYGKKINHHCWIGMNVLILKNSVVPENSIIGANSVYHGNKYSNSINCIFAGNPAKIIKEDIDWECDGTKYGYIDNIY